MAKLWKVLIALALFAPIAWRLSLSAPPKDTSRKTVMRYMAWGYPSQLGTERKLVEAFEAQPENADIDVEFIMAPMQSYYDKLQLMLVSGTGPDVVRVNPDHFFGYVKLGFAKDVEPYMQSDPQFNLDDFFLAARNASLYNGRHYGVGVLFTTTLVYYNKTIFQKAGVKDPWQRYQDNEWDWNSFLDAAKKTTIDEESNRQYGCDLSGSLNVASFMVPSWGGRLLSPDRKTCLVNSPQAVDALQWVVDVVWKWRAAPTPAQSAMSIFTFESGKMAMMLDSSGESPRLRDAISKFEWDVAPTPVGPTGIAASYGAHLLIMNSATKVPDVAWRYMRFMTSPVAEKILGCQLRRCIPTRRAIALSEEYLRADGPPYNMRAFIARVDNPQPETPYDDRWPEWSSLWQNYIDAAFLSTKPVQQAMDEAVVEIDKVLAGETD